LEEITALYPLEEAPENWRRLYSMESCAAEVYNVTDKKALSYVGFK